MLAAALLTVLPASESVPWLPIQVFPGVSVRGTSLSIGPVVLRGQSDGPLRALSDRAGFTNGTDTFYPTKLPDGGTFVLYRYAPSSPTVTTNPYPEITLPGTNVQYVKAISQSPFYQEQTVAAPFLFSEPFRQFKWPGLISDAGIGVFMVAESPIFEEAIEPFVSAYPTVRVLSDTQRTLRVRFDQPNSQETAVNLNWTAVARTTQTTTYVAPVSDLSTKAIAIHLTRSSSARRVWYRSGGAWIAATTELGGPSRPDFLLIHTDKPTAVLIESQSGAPAQEALLYPTVPGYVQRARWAAFTIDEGQTAGTFFEKSMIPSMKAYNDQLYSLRDSSKIPQFSNGWRSLLEAVGFTAGKNLLNPKFFNRGFPVAGDPSYALDPNLEVSVSWVSDEAALQAVMGARLFGFKIDPRYAEGVKAFYDRRSSFYYGELVRATGQLTSADTGSNNLVIGYNYLLSLMRLSELVGSDPGLPAQDVQKLVDRVLPVLQAGYIDSYPQVAYLWSYPDLAHIYQSEYGMGRELSEAQLSYVCGLWWLKIHQARYLDCETRSLELPEQFALTLQGSSYLWGLDIVHGAYVTDALLLAYRTTGQTHYLNSALSGWREELLSLFSTLNYPETPFDDRGITVTSYYSTFADLRQGNYWRDDSWNNVRTLWSLSKLLAYTDDARITWQLNAARQTHKQSMPAVDAVYNPKQQSDYYKAPIDQNDFALNYEDLRNHYSTQIAYSNDEWREAFIFDSIHSATATVYRIPGALVTDPGLAYVVGKPGSLVRLTIDADDCLFANGQRSTEIRLESSGSARLPLVAAQS
jgi:hypothetical protein